MDTILYDDKITFKCLEKKIFSVGCFACREMTKKILEGYDRKLMIARDKKAYRHKGRRKTTIKTVYGEVEYSRNVYEVVRENGDKEYVYLLDEQLMFDKIGVMSQNLVEQMVSCVTEMSYRESAKKLSEITGQSVSAMGIWNVIQELGENVCEDEKKHVEAYNNGTIKGDKKVPVVFEETDGVYVGLQGKDRADKEKGEIKVGIAYDGWKHEGKDRYSLDGKVVVAGFEKAKDFQEYREAAIGSTYDLAETELRILNSDGASWIKKIKDKATVFQLDPFHRNKAIREKITDKQAAEEVFSYLTNRDVDGMFEFLAKYKDSISDEAEAEKVEELITYFGNNEDGLLPYQEQGFIIPEPPEGLEYRNMGTMENHIWSIIARRMKHRHASWSIKGGNHLAKILAKKGSGKLSEVTRRFKAPVFEKEKLEEVFEETGSAGRTPKKEGKGYQYPYEAHVKLLETAVGASRKGWMNMVSLI